MLKIPIYICRNPCGSHCMYLCLHCLDLRKNSVYSTHIAPNLFPKLRNFQLRPNKKIKILRKFYTFKKNYFALCTCLRLPETDFQLFPSGASLLAPFRYQILSLVSIAQTWFFALQVTWNKLKIVLVCTPFIFSTLWLLYFSPNNECPEIIYQGIA